MKCPKCSSTNNIVKISNSSAFRSQLDIAMDQNARNRECRHCGHKWKTLELPEAEVLRLRVLVAQAKMEGAKR